MKPQAIAIWIGLTLAATATANPVGTINGHPVSEQEYRVFAEQEKPMVISYFIRTHGAVQSPSFWNTAWGGEAPTAVLAERVVRKIARTRIIQELGIEHGIGQTVKSYDDFMAELQEVNAQRRKWVDEGRVIYGPVQYKPDFYCQMQLDQIFSAVSKKLENAPEADRLVSDTEARAYYQRNKEHYAKGMEITYELARPNTVPQTNVIHTATETQDEQVLLLRQSLEGLNEGESVHVQKPGGVAVKCLGKKFEGYIPFDEAKRRIIELLTRERLEEKIRERVGQAGAEGFEHLELK